uniref:Uncharacterized protein n=1 Tax=Ascaris lumbricoides TaxID=6252 RepID=A0A0M3IS86_ASCLU
MGYYIYYINVYHWKAMMRSLVYFSFAALDDLYHVKILFDLEIFF